ncbi:hypothetical protein BGHDH14_bgh05095 [Blumeria hordei DH14]|uniref:Reverse transcriptase n=1 Tax=Blumeria graminis f. sp. hordei (strain DH14) TaxID=546991 RepID=N1JDC2_BLUG1|nr:hypothetical protein BGHDH14_bgh05095 [Blumeria hordei DH14]
MSLFSTTLLSTLKVKSKSSSRNKNCKLPSRNSSTVHVLLDSKAATSCIRHLTPGARQWIARRINGSTRDLQGHNVAVDQGAKDTTRNARQCVEKFMSLAYIVRTVTKRTWKECRQWFTVEHRRRNQASRNAYKMFLEKVSFDLTACKSRKALACRYFQLKSNHDITAAYLYHIKKRENNKCDWCGQSERQTARHLVLDCRRW